MLWTVLDDLPAQPRFAKPWVNSHAPFQAAPGVNLQFQWLAIDASVTSAVNRVFLVMQSEGDV